MCNLVGIGAGVLVGSLLGVSAPVVLGALLVALALLLLVVMPETGFKRKANDERKAFRKMTDTFREGFALMRNSRTLLMLTGVSFVRGASSEGFDRLRRAHLIANFTFPAPFELVLQPIAWVNRHISADDSHVRATAISMWSQSDALGQIIGGPAVGATGNAPLRLALTASALLLTPSLALFRGMRSQKQVVEPATSVAK